MTPENFTNWLRGAMLARPHLTNQQMLDLISDELKKVHTDFLGSASSNARIIKNQAIMQNYNSIPNYNTSSDK